MTARKIKIRSEWRVITCTIKDKTRYKIYRLQDREEPDEPGNRVVIDRYYSTRDAAGEAAERRNEKDKRMKKEIDQLCGTCKYHKCDTDTVYGRAWFCTNEKSENSGYYTTYGDTCEDWQSKYE